MKKTLLTLSLFSLVFAGVSASETPECQWASLMGGAAGDQSTAVAVDNDGNTLWLSTAASTEASPEIFYNGAEIFQGALYNAGNSSNNNLSLICTAPDGSMKWLIYSDCGEYASAQGNVAVCDNGDFVFTAKVRHTDGMFDRQMNLIDATGTKIEFGGTVEKRYYRLLVVKGNSQGEVLWTKLIDVSHEPAPAASGSNLEFSPDAVSSTALTVDNQGNIYVGGNYCSAMTIDGVTLEPTNVSSWSGDAQTSCGNMFLLKLDADGKYVDSTIGQGDINGYSAVQNLEWADGYLYFSGSAKGDGNAFTFAGVSMTPTDIPALLVGRLNPDLTSDWMKCCVGETVEDKSALQNVALSVVGGNMWVCGQYNQKIVDATDAQKYVAATQGKLREGFVIKFDGFTGEWLAAADSREDYPEITKLTGYLKVIQNPDNQDQMYVYGYVMDANIGIFLRRYDAVTLQPVADCDWSIATGGGVPTAITIAYDAANGSAYITGRGNKAFSLMGGVTTDAPKNWDVLMAKLALTDDMVSGVNAIAAADAVRNNVVYDLSGRAIGTLESVQSLAPGVYISNTKKFIVR